MLKNRILTQILYSIAYLQWKIKKEKNHYSMKKCNILSHLKKPRKRKILKARI